MRTESNAERREPRSLARASQRKGKTVRSRLAPQGSRESVGSLLARNAERFADRPAYAERRGDRFHAVTWRKLAHDVSAFARFLASSGVERGDRVVVFSPNRGEMIVCELATMCLGAIHVPIFAGYPSDQASALVEHAVPMVLILPGSAQLARISVPESVCAVVTFEPVPRTEMAAHLWGTRAEHTTFDAAIERFSGDPAAELRQAGLLDAASRVDPDDPCLMMYTSGTSGQVKGAVLTHDNILSQQRALSTIWQITPDDRLLSYLPWHHSFGGIFEKYTALYNGAALCLDDSLGKDFPRLLQNWREVQPTIYFSVPKLYQQLVAHAEATPEDEPRIFHAGLRFVFTAAAPLPARLSQFFADRGIPVLEGWGLTETAPCCTITDLTEPRTTPGFVGYPLPGTTVRIAADGEILVLGPNVMRGYFNNPEATHGVLPGDGWFHTGDLGELAGGGLRLIGRKDRVFKLLNAEKVVPTEIENRLAGMNPYIRHVLVAGAGRGHLCALVYPDYFRIAQEFGDDRASADHAVKASLRETMLAFNRDHPVPYERIVAFALVAKELTIEEQELTPSLKLRVRNVLERAEPYLEAVYEPSATCDCRFLRHVMRLGPDERRCFAGRGRTLDQCHDCGTFIYSE